MRLLGITGAGVLADRYWTKAAKSVDYLQAVADLVGSMLPAMVQHGIGSTAEIGHATLAERMQRETTSRDCLIIGRSEVGAWARLSERPEPR